MAAMGFTGAIAGANAVAEAAAARGIATPAVQDTTAPQPAPGPTPTGMPWLQSLASLPLGPPASGTGLQSSGAPSPNIAASLTIRQHSEALKPFTVAGKCGAFVGQQDGSFEAWTWPIKLISHFRMSAELEDYSVPIDVNDQAAEIEVAPDHTTITFAHAAFTIREILFAPPCSEGGAAKGSGVMALFQIDSTRPMTLTFNMTPEIKRMWPAANYNAPSPEWIAPAAPLAAGAQAGSGSRPGVGGYYILHTDSDSLSGALAMPGTEPGILSPYQERPKDWPLQLTLHYQPARDGARYFPLLMASGNTAETASTAALTAQLEALGTHAAELYQATGDYYAHFFDHRLVAETPDPAFNADIAWAEIAIDQLRVQHGSETGLVAGLYNSGDSNRPGFGWFFGRDALYTLFAINSYGDFALTRQELEFLLRRQRTDGKIMHEYSQTAELVDWATLPYEYAAADATPLFLMAVEDYVRSSGDVAFLKQQWPAIEKAYTFESTHDTDGDGIYDNAQGTGWVESWPDGMPHQEVYLAALDQQASAAYARLARQLGQAGASSAETRAKAIAATLEKEYYEPGTDAPSAGKQDAGIRASAALGPMYAFSRGKDGRLDHTATIYPSIAWFDGHYALPNSDAMFRRWASHEFSTDWGTRDLGEEERFYDPISYHQGSVWPLFTGWASLAEYRTGRTLSGYAHLMQNASMTTTQDLGAVTELLSGQYYQPFGRSTTHQLWSSAMVLEPALRGLFGLSFDAATDTLSVDPHLPATWPGATLHHVPAGSGRVSLVFSRAGRALLVREEAEDGGPLPQLAGPTRPPNGGQPGTPTKDRALHIPLPGAEISIPTDLPLPGARTTQLKVLEEHTTSTSATWLLEAQGGSIYRLPLRLNGVAQSQVEGASFLPAAPARPLFSGSEARTDKKGPRAMADVPGSLEVRFPAGTGYTRQTVTIHW